MRRAWIIAVMAVMAVVGWACSASNAPQPAGSPGALQSDPASQEEQLVDASNEQARVKSPADTRPAEDVARDADRKPREVLAFLGIREGMKVVELMAGRGYYVHLLADAVGPSGHVYAHNSPFVLERFAEKPLSERLADPSLGNVERLDTELDEPGLPDELDAVMIVLFYHDTYWQEVDRAKMNAAVFAALKPGGVYGVIDHHAAAGSGDRHVKSLHRVDAELVKEEVLAAGFELDAESDLLRHPEDARTINVFDEAIRGKTDRFVYRFRKPS